MTSEPYAFKTNATNLKEKTFTFNKFSGEGYTGIESKDVINSVSKYIKNNSAFYKCKSSLYGSSCSDSVPGGIKTSWGSTVTKHDDMFVLSYFEKQKYSTGRLDTATIKQSFSYKLTEQSDSITLALSPSSEANVKPASSAIGLPFSAPISDESVTKWAESMIKSTNKATIGQTAYVKGEFDVNLTVDSVKSNLIRGFDLKFSDLKNGVQFKARTTRNIGRSKVDINITLSVYRGKAKIEYLLTHPFKLTSDGKSSTYNKDIIKIVLEEIEKSANS
ncbi:MULTISPECIES: hypothetical protein [Colwellia]|nr:MULTISPECIES: hypothetical protein [Colwellia]